jgi:hypothetical protein
MEFPSRVTPAPRAGPISAPDPAADPGGETAEPAGLEAGESKAQATPAAARATVDARTILERVAGVFFIGGSERRVSP